MFHEFPKALFRGGDVAAECAVVLSAEDEVAKRAEGFRGAAEPQEKADEKRKPGRPRKDA